MSIFSGPPYDPMLAAIRRMQKDMVTIPDPIFDDPRMVGYGDHGEPDSFDYRTNADRSDDFEDRPY